MFRESKLGWIEISKQLKDEAEKIPKAKLAGEPNPDTPWHDDVHRAVELINTKLTANQLVWEIHEYSRRNTLCHNGIDELIRNREWFPLAQKITQDIRNLNVAYTPEQADLKHKMQSAIEEFPDAYFEVCKIEEQGRKNSGPKWCLSRGGTRILTGI